MGEVSQTLPGGPDPQGKVASHHVGYGEGSLQGLIAEMERQQAASTAG